MSSSEGKDPSLVTTSLLTVSFIFPIFGTPAVCLRIYASLHKSKQIFLDGCIIILAQICAWGISIDTFVAASIGGVNYTKGDVLSATVAFLRALCIEGFPLAASLALVKISILLFYARIFVIPGFRLAVYSFVAIIAAWAIAIIIAQPLCEDPITAAWDPYVVNPLRYNYNAFSEAFAGMSMVFDIIVLCFPIASVYNLQMSDRQKIQVLGIFWLGLFCCISSAIRFYYIYIDIHHSVASTNVSRYSVVTTAFIWGTIEPNASIVSPCLPLYGNLVGSDKGLRYYFKSFLSRLSLHSGTGGEQGRGASSKQTDSATESPHELYRPQRREWQKLGIKQPHETDIELGQAAMDDRVRNRKCKLWSLRALYSKISLLCRYYL
ncbi:uncharacterized protein BO97DRAFT_410812 [Aspergillus homomorphus CBS 101889]|uniref:Rhodopsin domain-containing protein n=1 Tax=Aspergillus homomorphus (strain CBS 101889) TaxID=1450537 RepID=A0A395I8R4_ASPHC|nr:hypothetical protein BO97DRAFT_410812 [Aspergillus homomorphus CBS 101889]RAL16421.1 hypothetical protein BO97DRAFT_410812 [Aspergillus homomorphus CBS 101889]